MKSKVTVSAPGKLMLYGEHSVVYDRPCIVTAVDQRMKATLERLDEDFFILNAPDVDIKNYKKPMKDLGKGDIPKGAKFVELAVLNFISKYPFKGGIKVTTKSEFSSKYGFGSSSASTVCTIFGLSQMLSKSISSKQIFEISYKTVLDVQGKGSGFDVAAAIYGGTIYYWTGGKIIKPINAKGMDLIVGYSGKKIDTVAMIDKVKKLSDKYPKVVDGIYDSITKIVENVNKILKPFGLAQGGQAQNDRKWEALGELMNFNHGYLESLGVSDVKLSEMLYAAKNARAYGAKMSSGGGDSMIALAPKDKKLAVEKAIKKSGGEIVKVKPNAEGVRVE